MTFDVMVGDCRKSMRDLAAVGFKAQMCVTSPPYFGLRDYGHDGQLGLEETPEQYIAAMVEVFRCVWDILAGTSERGHCPVCSARWARVTSKSTSFEGGSGRAGTTADEANASGKHVGGVHGANKNLKLGPVVSSVTTGWAATCKCGVEPAVDLVIDPFGGSGTTAGVAVKHGRTALMFELNADYAALMPARVAQIVSTN